MKIEKTNYNNVYFVWKGKRRTLLTLNLTPGKRFFQEDLIKDNDLEYREWDSRRSKLAAALLKNISLMPIKENDKVLYLGAAHGQTASYVSDIIGKKGFVFCLDFAPRVVRDLVFVCEERENMCPLLEDANKPENYKNKITEVDIIYEDIAQKNQVEILLKNIKLFLKPKGYALIAIKARSIDVTRNPKEIYARVRQELEKSLKVIDFKTLDPFERDHGFFVCQNR